MTCDTINCTAEIQNSFLFGTRDKSEYALRINVCKDHKKSAVQLLDYITLLGKCSLQSNNVQLTEAVCDFECRQLSHASRRLQTILLQSAADAHLELRMFLKPEITTSHTFQRINIDSLSITHNLEILLNN